MSQQPMMIDPYTGLPVSGNPDPRMGFPSPAPAKSDFMSKLTAALGGPQGLMNFGASLLAQSGPQQQRTSLGQALGGSLLHNQQYQQQQADSQLRQMLLMSQIERNRQRQQQNKNHVIGNALVDDTGKVVYQGSALDNTFGRVNPGDYDPESLAEFQRTGDWKSLKRIWAPVNPTVQTVAGVPTVVQPSRTGGPTTQNPLSTLPQEISAAEQRKQAEAAAAAFGGVQGDIAGGIQKKGSEAVAGGNILDIAEPLIDVATGSGPGRARDAVAGFFGKSTSGAEAIGQLRVLQAALMMNQPRMEGPQGEKDVELYQQAAGQIGDPRVPGPIKKAAMQTVRALQQKYKERAAGAAPVGSNIDALLDKYAPK
jgi:hypothetical protein